MPSIGDSRGNVFQGVQVTPDGIYGLKANDSGDGTFTPYKRNDDGSYSAEPAQPLSSLGTGGGGFAVEGGGFSTKMYDKEGNEYDPKTGKPINRPSPFDEGPKDGYSDKTQTEQQKAIADYQANRKKQLDGFLKINDDIFQNTIQSSNQFHQNTLQQIQMAAQAAQTQNIIEGMK